MNDEIRNNDIHSNWADSSAVQGHAQMAPSQPAASVASSPTALMPMKQIVTIRLDIDTLAWFKSAGPGYQTRINQLLRDHMQAQLALDRNAA